MEDFTCEIKLPKGTAKVTLNSSDSLEKNFDTILNHPEVAAAIRQSAEQSFPMLHYRHGNDVLEAEAAGKVVDSFLKSGDITVAEAIIDGWVDEEDYYKTLAEENFATSESEDTWYVFLKSVETALDRVNPDDFPDIDELRDQFDEHVIDCLASVDETGSLDQLKISHRISTVYIPGFEDGIDHSDVLLKNNFGPSFSSCTVNPDEALVNFLRFINVSSEDILNTIFEEHGIDLRASIAHENASDYQRKYYEKHAEAWRHFDVKVDPSRPALLSAFDAVEILDNASYGGVPYVFAHVAPRDFINLPWNDGDKSIRLEPDYNKSGVMVGIHDFMNGSGHGIKVSNPVTLPLLHERWHVDGQRFRYGINDVCGLVLSSFSNSVKAVESTLEHDNQNPVPAMK